MKKQLLIVASSMALLVAACGGGSAGTADTTVAPATSSTSTTTFAPVAEAADTTVEPSTTTTVDPTGPSFPLTGELLGDAAAPSHPAVVIKISNNDATARSALNGLDAADIIFEERIEQGATRFAAIFHSELPTEVGSVRSGRSSDIGIVSNLNNPVFAFSGANDGVHAQLRRAENDGLLTRATADFGDSQFKRIGDFAAPNNLVADAAALMAKGTSGAPDAIFQYTANASEIGQPSAGALVTAASNANYVWDESTGGYLRYQSGVVHKTRDDVHIAPQNVVVMTTTYLPSPIDSASVDAITIGSGPVVVYSAGFRVEGTWTREFARDPYTLTTSDGSVIGLIPGQTWVSLTPAGTESELSQEEAEALR